MPLRIGCFGNIQFLILCLRAQCNGKYHRILAIGWRTVTISKSVKSGHSTVRGRPLLAVGYEKAALSILVWEKPIKQLYLSNLLLKR